jgi:4-amino-4-deoxy-L-arabinose transferase-like glycosyltransferase
MNRRVIGWPGATAIRAVSRIEPLRVPLRFMRLLSPLLRLAPQSVILFVAMIFVSLLCVLPSVAKYHGDECFYTDAAIRMTQSGNYVTPYAAQGALRFAKPILPYWGVLAGYFVFGINFFASRFFFLVAGCLVIVFTYRLSLSVFGRQPEAVLAALIMGSNVQLLTISIRSTPDAFLCLFVLLSLLGFARLIFQNDRSWKNYALAYLGAGLAIETRGLPGVGVALYPFLFCLLWRRKETRLRQLLEWKAILLGLVVAGAWFGLMLWLHGRALVEGFYYDQVTENVRSYQVLDSLKNLRAYLTGVLRHFLPWSLLLALGLILDRRSAAVFWRAHRSQAWFLLGWFIFILVPFVFGGYYRTRYMIVAYPLLAVLLSGLLSRFATAERFERATTKLVAWAAVVVVGAGLALAGAGLLIQWRVLTAGLLLAIVGGLGWFIMRRKAQWPCWLAIAALPLAGFWAAELWLRPVFSSSPAAALTARLLPDSLMRRRIYALNVSPSFQAQMRVLSGGRLTVVPRTTNSLSESPLGNEPWVFSENEKPLLEGAPGRLEQVGCASARWQARDFLDLLSSSRREAAYARKRIPYYVLFPEPARPD